MQPDNDTSKIDWIALWKELDWDDEERQDEAARKRLRQRARQYASLLPDAGDVTSDLYTALSFKLGNEQYALDVMLVRTVRGITKVTPVPGTPRFYRGVVNIRGQIITVLDLRLFFDMNVDVNDMPGELIVVNSNNLEIGVLAHHVQDIISLPTSSIEPLEDVRYAKGITADRLILLDIARLFEDERLIVGGVDE